MCRIDIIRGPPGMHPVCFYTERRRQPWKRGILNKRSTIYYTTTSIVTQFKGYRDKCSQLSQSFYCCGRIADAVRLRIRRDSMPGAFRN